MGNAHRLSSLFRRDRLHLPFWSYHAESSAGAGSAYWNQWVAKIYLRFVLGTSIDSIIISSVYDLSCSLMLFSILAQIWCSVHSFVSMVSSRSPSWTCYRSRSSDDPGSLQTSHRIGCPSSSILHYAVFYFRAASYSFYRNPWCTCHFHLWPFARPR